MSSRSKVARVSVALTPELAAVVATGDYSVGNTHVFIAGQRISFACRSAPWFALRFAHAPFVT